MDMSTDISSHSEQEPTSDPFVDSIQEGDNVQEEEVVSELARIVEDFENGVVDTTLARLGAEDIALDMDDIFIHQDDWSDSSSEGSVDGVDEAT
jgi:hypothetical protein